MNLEWMYGDPGSPTQETGSRVLQLSARTLWLKPPDLVGWEVSSVHFYSFLPFQSRRGVFC